jgi:ferric-dicitrate binding protein FerR (iron transport regulator)
MIVAQNSWANFRLFVLASLAEQPASLRSCNYFNSWGREMMTTNTRKIGTLMFCLTLAFLAEMSHLAQPAASARQQLGLLTVTGTVRVNGKPAATGDIVPPASEIETAKGSSAVVSLGKLGRVEALPSTTMKLRYDVISNAHAPASVAILLGDGGVRVSTGKGIRFNIESGVTATRAGSETGQDVFTVDRTCGSTLVSVAKGRVELRDGGRVKQIAEGGQDTGGQAEPGCTPTGRPLIGSRNSGPLN